MLALKLHVTNHLSLEESSTRRGLCLPHPRLPEGWTFHSPRGPFENAPRLRIVVFNTLGVRLRRMPFEELLPQVEVLFNIPDVRLRQMPFGELLPQDEVPLLSVSHLTRVCKSILLGHHLKKM